MKIFALAIIAAALAHADCIAIRTDRVMAGDLAAVVRPFQALDPATLVAFTPLPGTRRVISGGELRAVAERNGVRAAEMVQSVCVERQASPIDRAALEKALIESLSAPYAKLELLDFSNQPIPEGRFEFHLSALSKPSTVAPEAGAIWRGRLIYDGGRSLAIWAKVRVTLERTLFVAAEEIAAGAVIREDQVQRKAAVETLPSEPPVESMSDIAGKIARRKLAAGQRFTPALLERPKEVLKGSPVHVRVIDGLASLSFDAVAEGSGSTGESILVHNPASGRNFRAVIEGKGQVIVRSGGGD